MPIISEIGRRSVKVRLLYVAIYSSLVFGSITMIYPLLLMLSGSVKSEADSWSIKPYPEFWFNERILFQKYAESKYNGSVQGAQKAWCRPVLSWRSIEPPPSVAPELLRDFRDWRHTLPRDQRSVGGLGASGMLPVNLRSYRAWMARKYNDDLTAYNRVANQFYTSWSNVRFPAEGLGRYRNRGLSDELRQGICAWRITVPVMDTVLSSARGDYVFRYLYSHYSSSIGEYNNRHGTSYNSYDEVPWSDRVPAKAGLAREDWEKYVRRDIWLGNVALDASLEPAFRRFIEGRYTSIDLFNRECRTSFATLSAIPFPLKLDDAPYLRQIFEAFLQSQEYCPIEAVSVPGNDASFQNFLVKKHGHIPDNFPGLGTVIAAADWADCMENKLALRWEFTMRNYWQVIDYLAMHGNGLWNTFVYCSLAVLTALIVNPLAAYALSRFRLPGTYKILLFCMSTMAFPGEVTMIPGFLLLKRFPLLPIIAGVAVTVLSFICLEKFCPKWRENWRALLSLLCGLLAGCIGVPSLGQGFTSTSLLNSFAALILPGMASGYNIFLLKGFFDSMPKELYEAADIDGAGEWTKFWMLTMNLSKPILAVIALGAFTHAYSAFMMALVIIPDQKMWTIMVWIFQLQTMVHQSVVYASLVIAALPTFLFFVFCQNLILRGIVIPTEK